MLFGVLSKTSAPNIIFKKNIDMKYILLIVGGLLAVGSGISIGQYILDYGELSQYGKGYIWGKVLLFMVGWVLLYAGIRQWRKAAQ